MEESPLKLCLEKLTYTPISFQSADEGALWSHRLQSFAVALFQLFHTVADFPDSLLRTVDGLKALILGKCTVDDFVATVDKVLTLDRVSHQVLTERLRSVVWQNTEIHT